MKRIWQTLPARLILIRPALLASGAAMLLWADSAPVSAQTNTGLRGPVDDEVVTNALFPSSRRTDQQGAGEDANRTDVEEPDYEPVSQGAVTDDGTSPVTPFVVEAPRDLGSEPSPRQNSNDLPDMDDGEDPLSAQQDTRSRDRRDDADTADDASRLRRSDTVDAGDDLRNIGAQTSNERTGAIETIDSSPEDDPYAPLGMRLGTFDVTASLEQGLTVTDNIDSSPGGSGGVLSETSLRLNAVSDWSRHSAQINAYYTHLQAVSGGSYSEPSAGIDGTLALELGNEYQVNAAAGYQLGRESAVGPSNAVSRSLRHTINGSLGFEKSAGKLRYGIEGAVQREQFSGGAVSQSDRNATLLSATLRGGYEISPAFIPFLEAEIGRRIYDEKLDQNGLARSSNRLALRAGTEFDLGEKLTGEVAAGWLRETLDDAALDPVTGLSVDASLNWSPSRATTIALNASTDVETTTTAGSSGSLLYSGDIVLTRQIRSNLTAEASIGGYYRDFTGSGAYDVSYNAGLGFTYWFNRYFGLTGRASHEAVSSSDPNREYSANRAFLGIRLQR